MITYDQKCYDLAEAFLEDYPERNTAANRDQLAKDIQVAIEDFLGVFEAIEKRED